MERTGHSVLSTLVISSRLIITRLYSDPYSDPYHDKTGRHALTSNKIYFSKKSGIATLSGTWRNTPAHGKIQYIPVRIPPSPPQQTLEPQRFQGLFVTFLECTALWDWLSFLQTGASKWRGSARKCSQSVAGFSFPLLNSSAAFGSAEFAAHPRRRPEGRSLLLRQRISP